MICRKDAEADPTKRLPKYKYLKKSLNTTLHPHIEKFHLDLYSCLAKENGWKISLPGLISQAQSQASEAASQQDGWPDKFDTETFHQQLLNFIIADDQVRFHFCLVYICYTHVALFPI